MLLVYNIRLPIECTKGLMICKNYLIRTEKISAQPDQDLQLEKIVY